MDRLVVKIGGSVLVDENSYQLQAEKLDCVVKEYNPSKLYVVVSAKKGETDRLIREVSKLEDEQRLRDALEGKCIFPEYDNPDIAKRLLQGEIESANTLKRYIPNARLIVQNSSFPLIAKPNYLYGSVDLEQSHYRKSYLKYDERIVIIPGFGAVNQKGDKVLLGRDSSDLVAAAIARLVDADRIIFLKDVGGIYRKFGESDQEIIPQLQYQEAKSIDFGQVIGKRALDLLEGSKLEVIIGHHEHLIELVKSNRKFGTRILPN